jgi:hypothetical protein
MYLLDLCPGGDSRPSVSHVYEILSTQTICPVTSTIKVMKIIFIILIIIQNQNKLSHDCVTKYENNLFPVCYVISHVITPDVRLSSDSQRLEPKNKVSCKKNTTKYSRWESTKFGFIKLWRFLALYIIY